MIFRRIKAHVAKEDWFAVFIDFLIVVFGVFMGFQVNNWNENRANIQKEGQLIERLVNDLSGMRSDFKLNDIVAARIHQGWVYAFRSLENCQVDEANADAIDFALGQYQRSFSPSIQRAAYDEMQSTGAFSRLADADLQNNLTALYANLDGEASASLGGRTNQLAAGRIMWKYIAFSFEKADSFIADLDTWGTAVFNPLDHCDNLELRGAMWEMVDTQQDWLNASNNFVTQIDAVLARLDLPKN